MRDPGGSAKREEWKGIAGTSDGVEASEGKPAARWRGQGGLGGDEGLRRRNKRWTQRSGMGAKRLRRMRAGGEDRGEPRRAIED